MFECKERLHGTQSEFRVLGEHDAEERVLQSTEAADMTKMVLARMIMNNEATPFELDALHVLLNMNKPALCARFGIPVVAPPPPVPVKGRGKGRGRAAPVPARGRARGRG